MARVPFPPALRPGDTVALVAPARRITAGEVAPAVRLLQSWGLRVQLRRNAELRHLAHK